MTARGSAREERVCPAFGNSGGSVRSGEVWFRKRSQLMIPPRTMAGTSKRSRRKAVRSPPSAREKSKALGVLGNPRADFPSFHPAARITARIAGFKPQKIPSMAGRDPYRK